MKRFWITVRMGRTELDDNKVNDETLEDWLQQKLEPFLSLFVGQGRVCVERVDPSRIDVSLNFTVDGNSVSDVMDRFRTDFETLAPISQGVDINETKTFKLCFPSINDEQFHVFVRVNPESGRPMYTEE